MLNFIQAHYISMILFSLSGCLAEYDLNEEFVRKYKDENFEIFINTSFLIRSIDQEGNLIIFVNTDFKNAYNEGPYIMTIDKETGKVKNASFKLMKDSVNFNKEFVHSLALKFLKYNIYSLAVDENRNIYIRLKEAEGPMLIRFSDSKYINDEYKKNWRRIEGNWFEKK